MDRKCANCQAFNKTNNRCLRHAPRPVLRCGLPGSSTDESKTCWPITTAHESCVEFVAIEGNM
jgi:hypothetical protein